MRLCAVAARFEIKTIQSGERYEYTEQLAGAGLEANMCVDLSLRKEQEKSMNEGFDAKSHLLIRSVPQSEHSKPCLKWRLVRNDTVVDARCCNCYRKGKHSIIEVRKLKALLGYT